MSEKFSITKEHCQKLICGVCDGCGGELQPCETVDNSNNPTYWPACMKCSKYCYGIDPLIQRIARRLVEDGFVAYSHMRKNEYDQSDEHREYYLSAQTSGACSTVAQVLKLHSEFTKEPS